jgi:hypothetical protein
MTIENRPDPPPGVSRPAMMVGVAEPASESERLPETQRLLPSARESIVGRLRTRVVRMARFVYALLTEIP